MFGMTNFEDFQRPPEEIFPDWMCPRLLQPSLERREEFRTGSFLLQRDLSLAMMGRNQRMFMLPSSMPKA
jgi:hypothetical protein